MLLSFEDQDTIAIYNRIFPQLIEQMNKTVNLNPKIENDAMLKQYILILFIIIV